ncbi:hypothetical protein PMAYCL1PPCAC_08133, partial [Pristionchus mayeri]
MDALFFWVDAMSRKNGEKKVVLAPPLSPLNRQLVAGMADPTSPIALLVHCKEPAHPCPDYGNAMVMLATKLRKCDVVKFNEEMNQYFEEALRCGVCVEYKRLRSGNDFVAHAVSDNHIANATANEGQVSQRAIRFWLDALCEAGAAILPAEVEKVERLFGK